MEFLSFQHYQIQRCNFCGKPVSLVLKLGGKLKLLICNIKKQIQIGSSELVHKLEICVNLG